MFEPKKFSLIKSADAYLPEYGNELISVYRKSAIMLGLIVAAIVLFYVLVLEKYLVGI
jgi:hypothetical protein